MSKYDDCHRVDNRYTTAIGMSVWRFFNPFYVAWCLENWLRTSVRERPRTHLKGE